MNGIPDWAVEGLMILGGLFFIYRGIQGALMVRASRGWPTTTGTVTSAKRSASGNARATIHFTYTVEGKDYADSFSVPIADLGVLDRLRARYPIGGQARVHYNPRNPGQSVVESDQGVAWLTVILGVAIAGAGLFFLIGEYVFGPR